MPTAFSMTKRDQMYLFKAAKEAKPVRLVCLDVALSSLPDEDALFALGVDRPLYFSVHSAYAKLAPNGGALIHIAKYLGTSIEPKPREDQPDRDREYSIHTRDYCD